MINFTTKKTTFFDNFKLKIKNPQLNVFLIFKQFNFLFYKT